MSKNSIFDLADKFDFESPFKDDWTKVDFKNFGKEKEIGSGTIFVTQIEGPTTVCEGGFFEYKIIKFNREDFKIRDILSKLKWGYSIDDNSTIVNIITPSKITGKMEVSLKWKIPKTRSGEFIRVYAWLVTPTKSVSTSANILKYPFLFDKFKEKGLNREGTRIADDMCYGNGLTVTPYFRYTKEEIENLGTIMKNVTMKAPIRNLWLDMDRMVSDLFSFGELKQVALKMVDHFKQNKGLEFSNSILNRYVMQHTSTKEFCKRIEIGIQEKIKDSKGDISKIFNNTVYFDDDIERGRYGRPQFSTTLDTIQGLRIMINDTWAYEVFISDFNSNDGVNYSLRYKVIIYDHFGLDYPDLQNQTYYLLAGFRSWFVLQHYHSFKPFITKMEFDKSLKGNIKTVKK